MTVYVVVDNDVLEPEPYREYLAQVTPTVAEYGGHYVVRGGTVHYADTDWRPPRLVIMGFATLSAAQAWVTDERMAPIHALRRAHAHSRMIIVDGIELSGGEQLDAGDEQS